MNTGNHAALYKHDMRPVFRSVVSNKKWARIQSPARFTKSDGAAQLYFEHSVEHDEDKIYFAFTYPYTYTTMQNDLDQIERKHENDFNDKESIYFYREVVLKTPDGLNMDLVTITSIEGIDPDRRSEEIDGLFCCRETSHDSEYFGALDFPNKEIVYLSARVHPGEVPAQFTLKGALDLLMDPADKRARELRKRFVFKLVPILNPDGVFRGHFRMDQFGNNLNRYYTAPDRKIQPTIFGAVSLLDLYAGRKLLSACIDMHAHASKRGCFIYGNVMNRKCDQVHRVFHCRVRL
jgi:hypothetical protein